VFYTDQYCNTTEQSEYSVIYNEDYPLSREICFKLKPGAASLYWDEKNKVSYGPGYAYLFSGGEKDIVYLWKMDPEVKDKDCVYSERAKRLYRLDRVRFYLN